MTKGKRRFHAALPFYLAAQEGYFALAPLAFVPLGFGSLESPEPFFALLVSAPLLWVSDSWKQAMEAT